MTQITSFAVPAQTSKNKRKFVNFTDLQNAKTTTVPKHTLKNAKNTKNKEKKDANTTIAVHTTKRFAQHPGEDGIAVPQAALFYTTERIA